VKKDGGSQTRQAMLFHARPSASLDLQADYTVADGSGPAHTNQGLHLRWKPAHAWDFDGQWRHETGADGPAADFHLTGDPNKATHVDARVQRIQDPKNPYRRQDTVRLERKPRKSLQWSLQYSALETKKGVSATVLDADARMETSLGLITASWRDGGGPVLPGYTDVAFSTQKGKGDALTLNARLRQREDGANTQTLDVSWEAGSRLTLEGEYARNPEDKHGHPQDLDSRRIAVHYELTAALKLDFSHSLASGPDGTTRCDDMTLKGRLDEYTTMDIGIAFHAVPSLPSAPAYHVNVEHTVDDDHRFQLAVERQTRSVQKKDDLTASLQLVSDF
jgi:hypothetical protein